jgi:AcrR family transcriptional regulator
LVISNIRPRRTRRALSKQHTHARILKAARQVFAELGFEGATLRTIAAAAGVTTGALFANFSGKEELFDDVVAQDVELLRQTLAAMPPLEGSIRERLLRLFSVAYDQMLAQKHILRTAMARAWTRDDCIDSDLRNGAGPLNSAICSELRRAVSEGAVAREIPITIAAHALWTLHLASYRDVADADRSKPELMARLGEQVDLLLRGYQAPSPRAASPAEA